MSEPNVDEEVLAITDVPEDVCTRVAIVGAVAVIDDGWRVAPHGDFVPSDGNVIVLSPAELPAVIRALVVAYRKLAPKRTRLSARIFSADGGCRFSVDDVGSDRELAEKEVAKIPPKGGRFELTEHEIVEFDCQCELGRP